MLIKNVVEKTVSSLSQNKKEIQEYHKFLIITVSISRKNSQYSQELHFLFNRVTPFYLTLCN